MARIWSPNLFCGAYYLQARQRRQPRSRAGVPAAPPLDMSPLHRHQVLAAALLLSAEAASAGDTVTPATAPAPPHQCDFNHSDPHRDGRCDVFMGLEPIAVLDPRYDKMLCYWPDLSQPLSRWLSAQAGRAHPVNPGAWHNISNTTGMPGDVRSRLSQPPFLTCSGSERCCFDGGFGSVGPPLKSDDLALSAPRHAAILLIDDLGYGDVGYAGAEYATPTIDALAHGGIRLNQSYVMQLCSPTRASLLTSRYSYTLGMDGNVLTGGDARCANTTVSTVGDQMQRQAGARTAFIGKYGA